MLMQLTSRARIGFCAAVAVALAMCGSPLPAQRGGLTIVVSAPKHAYHNAVVTVTLPGHRGRVPAGYLMLTPTRGQGGTALRAQAEPINTGTLLTFVLDDLKQGENRTYRLGQVTFIQKPDRQVELAAKEGDLEVTVNDRLFTRYATHGGPNKPFFYPILTPDGAHMTRRWPVEPDADAKESHDHPHHRGLWFAHSSINGVDFWSEQDPKVGSTLNSGFENVRSGWVYGGFTAKTEWRTRDGGLIATDKRDVRIYELANGDRMMDFSVTMTPVGGPLLFGDNKDGVFGLRVPDSLAIHPDRSSKIAGEGHIETSTGVNGTSAWGKPADWVDYWGPISGQVYGVAIFDAPSNIRHPETWHARDYALFTVNPFGLHDFGRGEKGAGDYTVPADKTVNFTYRLLFHKGDTKTAEIAEQYAAFTDPPEIRVK